MNVSLSTVSLKGNRVRHANGRTYTVNALDFPLLRVAGTGRVEVLEDTGKGFSYHSVMVYPYSGAMCADHGGSCPHAEVVDAYVAAHRGERVCCWCHRPSDEGRHTRQGWKCSRCERNEADAANWDAVDFGGCR